MLFGILPNVDPDYKGTQLLFSVLDLVSEIETEKGCLLTDAD